MTGAFITLGIVALLIVAAIRIGDRIGRARAEGRAQWVDSLGDAFSSSAPDPHWNAPHRQNIPRIHTSCRCRHR